MTDIVVDEARISIASDADTVIARQAGRDVALELGFSRTEATFVATAISEIARNIAVHAGTGEITVAPVAENGRSGLMVIARDGGPGIDDVDRVLRDDFHSVRGLGMGLWGATRLMDEVEVTSEPGTGTTVTMKKWRGFNEVGPLLDLDSAAPRDGIG